MINHYLKRIWKTHLEQKLSIIRETRTTERIFGAYSKFFLALSTSEKTRMHIFNRCRYIQVHWKVFLSFFLSFFLIYSVSIYLSIYPFFLSFFLSFFYIQYLSIYLSIYLSYYFFLSFFLSFIIYLSIYHLNDHFNISLMLTTPISLCQLISWLQQCEVDRVF